jgi:hypothetical protein
MKENKGGSSTPAGTTSKRSDGGTKPFAWRPPENDENNKRVIYGCPHTWNGKTSWVEDETPSLGLTNTPAGTNLTKTPSQVSPPPSTDDSIKDDATAITTDTKFSAAEQNEIRRIQANMQNLGASLASMFSKGEWLIIDYGVDGCNESKNKASLLCCTRSSLEDFLLPLLLLHAMRLTYYIDIVLWTTIRLVINWCCSICTNCLFYIIERIKTPHITIERTLTAFMLWPSIHGHFLGFIIQRGIF